MNSIILKLCFAVLFLSVTYAYDVVKKTGSTYTLHMDQKTWRQAKHACADDDAHLVILNDEAEAKVVFDMMKPLDLDFVAIGLKGEKGENSRWNYINGYNVRALFNQWFQEGYVATSPYTRCGFLNNAGKLADLSCSRESYYVCEKEN